MNKHVKLCEVRNNKLSVLLLLLVASVHTTYLYHQYNNCAEAWVSNPVLIHTPTYTKHSNGAVTVRHTHTSPILSSTTRSSSAGVVPSSSTSLYAFPDGKSNNNRHNNPSSGSNDGTNRRRKHHSSAGSTNGGGGGGGKGYSSKQTTKRNYKQTDDDDADPDIDLLGRSMRPPPLEKKFRPSLLPSHKYNNNNEDNKPQRYKRRPIRPTRNNSNNHNSNKRQYNANHNRRHNNNNSNNHNNASRIRMGTTTFNEFLIAPSLISTSDSLQSTSEQTTPSPNTSFMYVNTPTNDTSVTNPNNNNGLKSNDFIVSPTVLQQHEEGCEPYICGPLAVTYTNDADTVERWLYDHVYRKKSENNFKYVGFDVESVPNVPWRKRKSSCHGPATIQLSTPYASLVIHLTSRHTSSSSNHHSSSCACCSKALQKFLSDRTILKVGAGIDEDMQELYRYNPALNAKSRFDMGGIGSTDKHQRIGLQRLVRAVVGVELAKSKRVAMSDWSMVPLSERQICYASRDAWAGAAIMENLERMYPEHMSSEVIGKTILRNERDISEVSDRAFVRKKAKLELKSIIKQYKDYSSALQSGWGGSGLNEDSSFKSLLPDLIHEERDRLQRIVDETCPDIPLQFDSKVLGLDFSFDDPRKQ